MTTASLQLPTVLWPSIEGASGSCLIKAVRLRASAAASRTEFTLSHRRPMQTWARRSCIALLVVNGANADTPRTATARCRHSRCFDSSSSDDARLLRSDSGIISTIFQRRKGSPKDAVEGGSEGTSRETLFTSSAQCAKTDDIGAWPRRPTPTVPSGSRKVYAWGRPAISVNRVARTGRWASLRSASSSGPRSSCVKLTRKDFQAPERTSVASLLSCPHPESASNSNSSLI
mmetsp:Transcript_81554/g.162767  ORF Transcript_81554/g.162767 Transcript_81554/m.162767 type:complete len:231 (-) Transcript_81554:741-1433(-)